MQTEKERLKLCIKEGNEGVTEEFHQAYAVYREAYAERKQLKRH